jgi:signal transduction histidine kinase
MRFGIKTKLAIGLAFMFIILVLVGAVGLYSINRLKDESKTILKANYESLVYAKNMEQALDMIETRDPNGLTKFEDNLKLQEKNITEIGEQDATTEVRNLFDRVKSGDTLAVNFKDIRSGIYKITELNMNAIVRKNNDVQKIANQSNIYLAIIVTIGLVLSFLLLLKFPGYIANPVKELDLAKTNFIATVSHALKTPISSIKMSLKLLSDERVGTTNPEQKQLVGHIKEDTDRLLNITSELLNMTQVETGNVQLSFKPTHPKELIDYAVDTLKMQAEQKQVSLEVKCPPNLHKVSVDADKTVWVLVNLLSNALRYSPEKNKILIEAREQSSSIEFSVKDFGQGIEDKYKDRLFQRYYQVPGSQRSGTGLGLAISKEFIEAQNGKISVESKAGEGSRFYFTLPSLS